ncbi:MAG: hypothetical protein HYU64_19775 [Armatimonadetes bacterium]|nr:hypothetical protein [Armatimonadota bacterium]
MSIHDELEVIAKGIFEHFDAKEAARERSLALHREVIKLSGNAIRAVHRGEFGRAEEMNQKGAELLLEVRRLLRDHPDIRYAGFVQNAEKEHAEATIYFAIRRALPLPTLESLPVEAAQYLNGLSEAVGELRRYLLDSVRQGILEGAEECLQAMDDIYYLLVSVDYPDAITGSLRRSTDVARSIIEKTRGDLTVALQHQRLEHSMKNLEARL